jgi:hypothetical protein
MEAMYNDLEILWRHAMTDVLEIPKEEIPQLACVLIVPANVCKTDVKTMVHVLLSRMRLACVSVLQDAACASFQARERERERERPTYLLLDTEREILPTHTHIHSHTHKHTRLPHTHTRLLPGKYFDCLHS